MILQHGNHKLGKNIAIYNLPQGLTCPGKTPLCTKLCYARKAWRCYPQVPEYRYNNYLLSQTDQFENLINQEIQTSKTKILRVHESGDWYNQTYLNKWFNIAKQNPEVIFYAYTKSFHLNWTDKPANMIIYASIDSTQKGLDTTKAQEWIRQNIYAGSALMGSTKTQQEPPGYFRCTGSCKTCDHCYNKEKTGNVFLPLH